MGTNRPKDTLRNDIFDNSRRTMLFNERTDRSLHAELSQLDKNRKEIMRDLRKIKQIKTALQEQLKSVLEKTPPKEAGLEAKNGARPEVRLPAVETRRGRPRFHSDMGPLNNLIASERRRIELKGSKSEAALEYISGQNQQQESHIDPLSHPKYRGGKGKSESEYRTNQELRDELMIKSRFHQVGSKYVGKEIFDKKHQRKTARTVYKRKREGLKSSQRSSGGESLRKLHISDDIEEQKTENDGDLSADFSSLSILRKDVSGQAMAKEIENSVTSKHTPDRQDAKARHQARLGEHLTGEETGATSIANASSVPHCGSSVVRKLSSTSTGVLERDVFHKTRHDPVLPSIPLEFRSTRQDRGPNSLERAFMVCQQMNSNSGSLKSERKRRFANLVDLVIKQRKVIHAWEPILNTVGDIQSDDEV
eukprot:gene14418-5472_t